MGDNRSILFGSRKGVSSPSFDLVGLLPCVNWCNAVLSYPQGLKSGKIAATNRQMWRHLEPVKVPLSNKNLWFLKRLGTGHL